VRRIRDSYFLRAESYFNVATEIEALDREPGGPPIIDSYGGNPCTSSRTANRSSRCS
jgi:predicted ATPase